jgi:hypothetical protein
MDRKERHQRHEDSESIGEEMFEHNPTVTPMNFNTPHVGNFVRTGCMGKRKI